MSQLAGSPDVLIASTHRTRSGVTHLRVKQQVFREDLKEKLSRIGSPARWLMAEQAWDCPLNPAAVVRLAEVASAEGEQVEWRDGLKEYAEQHLKQSDYEHEVRLAIERVIRDNLPIDPYLTLMQKADGTPIPPLRHQGIGYHWSQRCRGLLLAWEMGCISGDAEIKILRHGKVGPIKLRDLYEKFNGISKLHPWKKRGRTTCKSLFPDGILRHNEICAVMEKGTRAVARVRLSGGKTITCTYDHEIATPDGWKRADQLARGDVVLTNGANGYFKYPIGEGFIDKDGYRRIRMPGHPRANGSNVVYEHIVVMEKKLGRPLADDEEVHHKDRNRSNNKPSNLVLLKKPVHKRLHGKEGGYLHMDGGRAGTGGEIVMIPRRAKVLGVEEAGYTDVYDIVMADPARNFVANGVIVHNCGKTRAATDAAGGWYRTGQIPPMQAAVIDGKPAVTGGVLVVCPRTMIQTWHEEVARWQNASAVQIKGTAQAKMRKAGQPAHFHITNYEGLKYVLHNRYAGLILDEIHRCANNTAQTNNALAIAEGATKKLGLTGTPIANDYKSIFYPMLLLDGGRALGPSRTAFLEKFFDASRNMAGFVDYSPHENAGREIAQAISASTYFVKKADVLDLPPKTHSPIYLPMTDEQKRYYDQIRRETLVYIQDATVTLEQASARMMKMLQICQGFALTDATMDGDRPGRHFTDAKTEALIEMLTDQLSNQKVIVWAYFQYEIKRLADALKAKGIDCLRIDGTITAQSVRDAQVRRWNTDPSVKVFIRQLSMSEGVTLLGTEDTPCFTSIYLTLSYRMVDLLQSQDRVHRIGQKNRCDYLYLLTESGLDRNVYARLLSKIEDAELVQTVGKSYYRDLLMQEPAA
jgi:SWI/SNF-related matrix-associated actin-dependent regulator of chromatin subfamily A-like protein 1